MMRILMLVISLAWISGMGPIALAEDKIVIPGTGDSQELLRALATAFERANPGTKIEVPDTIGSSGGIRATIEGKCDLARVARLFNEKEKAYNLSYKVFACSPVVFVANPSVKGVENLSFDQILALFSGKIKSWSELGGQNQKIYIAQREEGDACRIILDKDIPGWKEIKNFPGEVIYTTPDLIAAITKHENTIGYAPLSMLRKADLKLLQIAGVRPTVENVKNGSYTLVVPFAFVWKGELKGLAKIFIDYTFSPEGQRIIVEYGANPVR